MFDICVTDLHKRSQLMFDICVRDLHKRSQLMNTEQKVAKWLYRMNVFNLLASTVYVFFISRISI